MPTFFHSKSTMSVIRIATLLFLFPVIFGDPNCDNLGVLLYENLGCTPNIPANQSCPVSYSCSDLEPNVTKNCRTRNLGEDKSSNVVAKSKSESKSLAASPSVGPGCSRLFSCSDSSPSELFVAIMDCRDRPNPNCYLKYSLERCCSSGQVCSPFDANSQQCLVDGVKYREGERFFPENTCWKCVCQKGFTGKFEAPFCQRLGCGIDGSGRNIARICAPIYDQTNSQVCCPGDWLCPSSNDVPTQGVATTGPTCRYGDNRIVHLGQKFTSKYKGLNIQCDCILPPLVSCKWVY